MNIFSPFKFLHDPWYLFFISVKYLRCHCTWINSYDTVSKCRMKKSWLWRDTFFPPPLHSSHTVEIRMTWQQHKNKEHTSQRSSSILNSVKWLIIDEVWSSWSCPSNKTNRRGAQWTQLMKHWKTYMKWLNPLHMVGALLKHKIAGAHWSLN